MAIVWVKIIDGVTHYKVGAASGNDVTISDPVGTIADALTAASTNGAVFVCEGAYPGFETKASGQTLNGIGNVIISGAGLGTHSFIAKHSIALNNLEVTGAGTGFYNIFYAVANLTVSGIGLRITKGNGGIYNTGKIYLVNSEISGITGTYLINNAAIANEAHVSFSVIRDNTAYYTAFKGKHIVANNLFTGNLFEAFSIGTDNAQVVDLSNNIFIANSISSATKHIISKTSLNAVVTGGNNLVLGNPFNPTSYYVNGLSLTGDIFVSPKLLQRRRNGIVNLHMHQDGMSDATVLTGAASHATSLKQYITAAVRGVRDFTPANWETLIAMQTQGHSVLITTENHLSLTAFTAIRITGPTGATISVSVNDFLENSDNWSGSIILNESGEPSKYTLDISATGIYSNLLALSNKISSLSGWSCVVIDSGDGSGVTNRRNKCRSIALASVADIAVSSGYNLLLDRNNFYFVELVEPKAIMESNGIIINSMDCPGGHTDETIQGWLSSDSHGFFSKGGTLPFLGSWGLSEYGSYELSNLSVFKIKWSLVEDYFSTTLLDRKCATLSEFVSYIGGVMTIIFHNATYSLENWISILDGLSASNTSVVGAKDTIDYIRTGNDADGNGMRWEHTFSNSESRKIQKISPCVDAGIWVDGVNNTGSSDIFGKKVYGIPNIGPDQGAGMPNSARARVLDLSSHQSFF